MAAGGGPADWDVHDVKQARATQRDHHSRRLILVLVFVVALLAFLALAYFAQGGVPNSLDAQVHSFVDAHRSGALSAFFKGYTGLGQWFVLAAVALAAIAVLAATARRREAVFLFIVMTASLFLNVGLKLVFERGRPPADQALVYASGYALPSGHSMSSATLALALVVIAWPTRWRVPAIALAAVFTLLMGMSRIYLGVHWLTDVLAGWTMAVAIVTGTVLVMDLVGDAWARRKRARNA
jgi:membrane-associated phospholipid phosphatase